MTTYNVTIRFQFPAYDERNGLSYEGIAGKSKSDAIAIVRRQAERDGHLPATGKGRVTLTAVVES